MRPLATIASSDTPTGTNNTNKEQRTSAICLRPSNSQGGYYFMNIETGKKIHGIHGAINATTYHR